MNEPPPSGSLLDSLRAQSHELRATGEAARRPIEEALKSIDRQLWAAFRWLDEALGHLGVIRPSVNHVFQLGTILTIDRPQFDRGFVTYRRRTLGGSELLDHIEMFYSLTGPRPITLRVNPGGAQAIEERLRASTLPYHYQTEQDEKRVVRQGVFQVSPVIGASMRVQPDYGLQTLAVTLRNVDRFESVSLEFAPDKFDVPTLEDLVKLMLGESGAFLRRAPLAGMNGRRAANLTLA